MQLELQRELPRYAPQLALICLFGSVALILLCESFLARREIPRVPLIRWVSNLSLAILNQWVSLNILPILAGHLTRADWGNHPGVLQQIHAGFWSSWAITIVCLEFLGYCWHRLSHAVPWLWRIHAVHHSDVDVDARNLFPGTECNRSVCLQSLVFFPRRLQSWQPATRQT